MENSEKFIQIYNEIDSAMRRLLNCDSNYRITHYEVIRQLGEKKLLIRNCSHDLRQYADLRNAIAHNPIKDAKPIAEPHDIVVKKYEELRDLIINPPTVQKIWVPKEKIFNAKLDDNVIEVMQIMNKNTYTHVPVYDKDQFIGVFSENVVFSYLSNQEEIIDSVKNWQVKNFIDYLPIDQHRSEYFSFVSSKTLIMELQDIFEKQFQQRRRLAVVYVTQNGKQNEKILGMVTAWDLAGK
jgi:predicted transcriptional regulator